MSRTYSWTVSPASLNDHSSDCDPEPHHGTSAHAVSYDPHVAPPVDSQQLLSPYSSHQQSNSGSPSSNTPAESTSAYQSSDFGGSEFADPFFGVNFNDLEGSTPAFLDDHISQQPEGLQGLTGEPIWDPFDVAPNAQLSLDSTVVGSSTSAPQLTPDTNGESWSSEDSGAALAALAMSPSPRVMVSVWGKDGEDMPHSVGVSSAPDVDGIQNARWSQEDALSVETIHGSLPSVSRENWQPNTTTEHRGLAPERRPVGETVSINELAQTRRVDEKNQEVAAWVTKATHQTSKLPSGGVNAAAEVPENNEDDNIPTGDIPLGDRTVNRVVPGQTYYNLPPSNVTGNSRGFGGFNQTDLDLLPTRNWGDAPMMPSINNNRSQPESSQAAIERFERMIQDNESVISYAATWGTRRRSLPSVIDAEGVLSGNIFKKLSIRGDSTSRRASILRKIPSLVRRPSATQLLKRKGSNSDEVEQDEINANRRESRDSLAPPSRSPSWSLKQKPTPSLNTALVGMATGAASIGTAHARSGSISATPLASPKSAFPGLTPVRSLRRPRSKTESSHPNIVEMLKKNGGPPVAQLAKSQPTVDQDEDDDDDDDGFDEPDLKIETSKLEPIIPTFDGFKQHVLRLNPALATTNEYLVDRIAHQMIVRFKGLQTQKIKHLQGARTGTCQSGNFCLAQGGAAIPLDTKGDFRGLDPLSALSNSSDGDTTPLEGGIGPDSFPTGIPMPPTTVLPAEFECQLCFASRKFIKPSDWTKHVHEDVQPFTCTWERCREPKMFKRKADWVRHENEGHRHLEWWTCDVEDCRHTCYRRDNFLQHLVREHKFPEPKVKTKAAIKKAGGADPTWQRVERCHVDTQVRPQEEPCRFCGKTFPSWKKLTVHLAKHMEHISLPVLKLVDAKDLTEDTTISPVQEPPPRSFGSLPTPIKQEHGPFSTQRPHAISNPSPMDYNQQSQYVFHMQPTFYSQPHANAHFDGIGHNPGGLVVPQIAPPYHHTMPISTGQSFMQQVGPFVSMPNQMEPFPDYNNPLGLHDPNGGQLGYGMASDVMSNVDQYSNAGSVSPYNRSPHQGRGGFYS
ncbi:hypothetical protein BX600DRAFT_188250 [Xylariales sp. PMI_506]|nr:hypothetical protein BX600DRAFT_188250 [Xylariales sp. PMI_506]